MKITILESGRGLGKSTIARSLRDAMTNTVLINFTGNNEDSEDGMLRTFQHYNNFLTYLQYEKYDDSPFDYIFDRSFFSEQVYSTLYKSYNFTDKFAILARKLNEVGNKVDIKVIHLVASKDDIARNLKRSGKAHLFNNEALGDDVHKTMRQQVEYETLFKKLHSRNELPNVKFITADISNLTIPEATNYIKSLI